MSSTVIEIMESAYQYAKDKSTKTLLDNLPEECVQELKTIVENAENHKAVLGVTLSSIVYKIYKPSQDIRKHQEGMEAGYAGRTFDTKYVTPFLKNKFPHFAMAESAWLTRSLEQPHPYNLDYPGRIRNKVLKLSFLNILERVETDSKLASKILNALMALMLESSANDNSLFTKVQIQSGLTIVKIINAVNQHIYHDYSKGVVGTARLPVLAIYSVYNLLLSDVKRYSGKILVPLQSHTSPDSRSKSLGDIDINHGDNSCFESIEIKHNKPITIDMVGVAYRKIKDTTIDRYYILTTSEPNFDNYELVIQEVEKYKKIHPCQIIVNGVIPSLKYYMRLISNLQDFLDEYTKWLEVEFRRASGIKGEHLHVWQEIRQTMLSS